MSKQFANSGDPDQMPHSVAASELGLYYLSITFRGLQTKMGCFIQVLRHFKQSFSRTATVSGCGGEFNVDHVFLKTYYLTSISQHVSHLAIEALPSNSLLHSLLIQKV